MTKGADENTGVSEDHGVTEDDGGSVKFMKASENRGGECGLCGW